MRGWTSYRPSIRFYLILSYLVFILGGLITTGVFWFAQQESAAEESLLLYLQERARLTSTLNQLALSPPKPVFLPGTVAAVNENLRVAFVTPTQQVHQISYHVLSGEERRQVIALANEALTAASFGPDTGQVAAERIIGEQEALLVAAPVYDSDRRVTGAVCLLLPLGDFEATMLAYRGQLVKFAGGLAALSLLVGIGMAYIFAKPIHQAAQMASRVAGGDYRVRLPGPGISELDELAGSLNHLTEELDQQAAIRQQLLSNVTHELARPLSALSIGVESLRCGAAHEPEFFEDLLGEIDRTIKDVEGLLDDLALAARPGQAPLQLALGPVALKPFLRGLAARYRPMAESRDIRLRLDFTADLPEIEADEKRLTQVFGNLLDNAIKYSSIGGEVVVKVCNTSPQGVRLCVRDTGPGIPEDDHTKVVQPFYQGHSGRLSHQGMGLGLSIVTRLVQAHQGTIQFENVPGGGLLVSVWLPLDQGRPGLALK